MSELTRRQFLIRSGSAALGAAIAPKRSSASEASSAAKRRVVLVQNENALDANARPSPDAVRKMLDTALTRFSDQADPKAAWSKYIKPSDTVGIKMNVMMNATHPEVVRAIVQCLLDIGVKDENIIIWDRATAGIGMAGVEVRDHRFGYDEKTHLSKIVTEKCTALINVPGIKAHWIAGIAVALKNWVGAISGLNPSDKGVTYAIHADSAAECCQFNAMPPVRNKCRLVIVDALRPLCQGGPQVNPRFLWPYKGLLVSTDPVAMDTVSEKIIQDRRDEMKLGPISPPAKHVRLADTKYHLGTSDWNNIDLVRVTV